MEPPFSVLDTKGGNWQNRKRQWKNLGIKSEVGTAVLRAGKIFDAGKKLTKVHENVLIFKKPSN